ncbi:MAG: DUF447 family protein [Candidatus Bathyarchaeota archaeon]|nr:MAG: DUF447 family protein [Candidatus Bathyarchaeota archaeon]
MTTLFDLGFRDGIIAETIVSTYDSDGKPNAAPMGIVIQNTTHLFIRPYVSSLTYKNLQITKNAVVNLTVNPRLFYITAFKETNPNGKLPPELFQKAKTVSAPRLKMADAFIEVSVEKTGSFGSDRAECLCNVKHVETINAPPYAYCRAKFATIEAIVYATRIELFLKGNKQQQKQALRLLELVNICTDVVNRTAPTSVYSDIMADLTQRIDSWRNQK